MSGNARKRNAGGFTLIEVLIGILIFAVGMMALAQLQGSLARNSTDSNSRTVAANIGEEIIETARRFSQITSDGTTAAYNDIVDGTQTITDRGNTYTVVSDVTDYYYVNGSFTTTEPTGAARSDMKLVEVTVSWDGSGNFYTDGAADQEGASGADLGSGSIVLRDVISSITSPSGGKVALGTAGDNSFAPPVNYNPGQNPDIVSIQLGNNKFKESTTPLPDVIRANELVETRFDVVTYSQSDDGATFLRREEFRAVSCECTLRASTSTTQGGLRPTIWEGTDYTEAEFVAKPYGVSASNQQSIFCDICCRDHHDGGSGAKDVAGDPGRSKYDPFRPAEDYHADGAFAGNHKHYNRNNVGTLVVAANDGDRYLEACRLVRKDGFFRVAQDLRQEGLNAFPADYLDDSAEVDAYSDYVTAAVDAYEIALAGSANGNQPAYELNPPSLIEPQSMSPAVVFPASTPVNPSYMREGVVSEQQLRARGIYLDYMSDALRAKINCLDLGGTGSECGTPDVTTALEIIPFYDVQLTWLARWNEAPQNFPIDVTNQAIANDNTHSRGLAILQSYGTSTVNSAVHNGNLGLTGTDPIDLRYDGNVADYDLHVRAADFDAPPVPSGVIIEGTITSAVPGVKAADVEIEATGALCGRTNTGFRCDLLLGESTPRLKIFNYYKPNQVLVGCSVNGNLSVHGSEIGANGWTRFNLPLFETLNADIVIRAGNC